MEKLVSDIIYYVPIGMLNHIHSFCHLFIVYMSLKCAMWFGLVEAEIRLNACLERLVITVLS